MPDQTPESRYGPADVAVVNENVQRCRASVKEILGSQYSDDDIDCAIGRVQVRLNVSQDSATRVQEVVTELLDNTRSSSATAKPNDAPGHNDASPTPASSPVRSTSRLIVAKPGSHSLPSSTSNSSSNTHPPLGPKAPAFTSPTAANKADAGLAGEDEEMQKAIALSLDDSHRPPQLSKEEQELQRALAESMQDAKAASSTAFSDPADPNLRKRNPPDWPVGLKNVGNTCWFSVVIQALFHLPAFRNLIFSCATDVKRSEAPAADATPSPKLEFMRQLQRVFGLLFASNRKYVDPSAVVEQLRDQSPSLAVQLRPQTFLSTATQEDVSEVIHSLMALMEGGFKEAAPPPSSSHDTSPPSVALLPSLHCEADSSTEGWGWEPKNVIEDLFFTAAEKQIFRGVDVGGEARIEEHLLLPLQVHSCRSVEDGLEASFFSDIEDSSDPTTRSETWLVRTPPVLLLDLKRFAWTKERQTAEKLHSRLSFPPTLYMDRFLKKNHREASARRTAVLALREKHRDLSRRLAAYESYGLRGDGTSTNLSLQRILELTRAFINGDQPTADLRKTPAAAAALVPSPPDTEAANSPMDTDSGKVSPRPSTAVLPSESMDTGETEQGELLRPTALAPINQQMLDSSLGSLVSEVSAAVGRLRGELAELEREMTTAYDDPALQQCAYRLHAVLVHEGQASSGHYWAFLRLPPSPAELEPETGLGETETGETEGWLKFNDVQVSPCGWADVVRDAYGGSGLASAYCLFYVADEELQRIYHGIPAPFVSPAVVFPRKTKALFRHLFERRNVVGKRRGLFVALSVEEELFAESVGRWGSVARRGGKGGGWEYSCVPAEVWSLSTPLQRAQLLPSSLTQNPDVLSSFSHPCAVCLTSKTQYLTFILPNEYQNNEKQDMSCKNIRVVGKNVSRH